MMPRHEKVMARYEDYNAFKNALGALKDRRQRSYKAYGPTNLEEIEPLMPEQGSLVRGMATVGAIVGLVIFWLMCVLTSLIYGLVVGGKPPVSNVAFVVPAYEGTILVGAVGAFAAGIAFALLGPRKPAEGYNSRLSQDSYGVEVECGPGETGRIADLLKQAGAVEVYEPDQ